MPSATPTTSSTTRRSRWPTETLSAMTAAIGAKNGRGVAEADRPGGAVERLRGEVVVELRLGLRLTAAHPQDHQVEDRDAAEYQAATEDQRDRREHRRGRLGLGQHLPGGRVHAGAA